MLYTIYKTTNLINGIYYIGMHQTKKRNDDYYGSGVHLKVDMAIYGKNNFKKEILHEFNNRQDMVEKEKELVVVDYKTTYNRMRGGHGSFYVINKRGLNVQPRQRVHFTE